MKSSAPRGALRNLRPVTTVVALAAVATTFVPSAAWASSPVAADEAAAAAAAAPLGSKSRPAASCWEIKEQRPEAESGSYWLWTPQLEIADQFYCDQETDGGGWVMIGRGREDWDRAEGGTGSMADVRKTIAGRGAFAPRALSSKVINGLFGGGSAAEQEMRLRRALDGEGTRWQEARFRYGSEMSTWSWKQAMGSTVPVRGATFDGVTNTYANTVGWFGGRRSLNSAFTKVHAWNNNVASWSYQYTGAMPGATAADDSYVYRTPDRNNVPFTQVYARPKVSSEEFPAVAETGFAEKRTKATVRSGSMKNPWGVTGRSARFRAHIDVEVQDFAEDEAAGQMYVGGNFTTVQRSSSGADAAKQEFLASFDAVTGEWNQEFRPQLDGQVKAIKVLPGDRLAVGGEFSTADGEPHEGFVVLDKNTGRVHEDFSTLLINRVSAETVSVFDLEIEDGFLYLGGKFTHATNERVTREVYSRNLMRLSLDDLSPDRTFFAETNGGVFDLDIHRGRLYAAGTFSANRGASALRALAIDLADNSQIPWKIHHSYSTDIPSNTRQNGVVATDSTVWLTGAQHLTASYDADDLSLNQTWITLTGGDGQTIASNGDTVFSGCHCWGNTYEGARTYPQKSNNYESISAIGAYDAKESTIQRSPEVWDPVLSSRRGDGAWASLVDSRGTLWVGGDLTYARPEGWADRRWTGGFVRFEQAGDATAPSVPAGVSAVSDGTWDALSWDAAGEKGITYQVFRVGSGELVAQTTDTAVTVPAGPKGSRYLVRAHDEAGNISATSDPVAAEPGEVSPELIPEGGQARPVQVISPRGTWSYSFDAGRPQGWPAVESLASSGVAPLGWGTKDVVTTFPAGADGTRPLASYFARSFEVPAGGAHKELVVSVRLDDGAAVYLNGKEVHRENLPDGELADRTYATTSVPGSAAPDNVTTFRIPASELTPGKNTITAEVHSNWTKAPSSTFELEAVLR